MELFGLIKQILLCNITKHVFIAVFMKTTLQSWCFYAFIPIVSPRAWRNYKKKTSRTSGTSTPQLPKRPTNYETTLYERE
jgi:hypothetical protein